MPVLNYLNLATCPLAPKKDLSSFVTQTSVVNLVTSDIVSTLQSNVLDDNSFIIYFPWPTPEVKSSAPYRTCCLHLLCPPTGFQPHPDNCSRRSQSQHIFRQKCHATRVSATAIATAQDESLDKDLAEYIAAHHREKEGKKRALDVGDGTRDSNDAGGLATGDASAQTVKKEEEEDDDDDLRGTQLFYTLRHGQHFVEVSPKKLRLVLLQGKKANVDLLHQQMVWEIEQQAKSRQKQSEAHKELGEECHRSFKVSPYCGIYCSDHGNLLICTHVDEDRDKCYKHAITDDGAHCHTHRNNYLNSTCKACGKMQAGMV
ncbi:hypothetical protein JCM5296_004022 [Sporobolomyces johnsonii]